MDDPLTLLMDELVVSMRIAITRGEVQVALDRAGLELRFKSIGQGAPRTAAEAHLRYHGTLKPPE